MAKIRYNYEDNAGVAYQKKSSGKTWKVLCGMVVLFFAIWGLYVLCFGESKEETPAEEKKTNPETPAAVVQKAPAAVKVVSRNVPVKKAVDSDIELDAVNYPLGAVSLDRIPVLKNAANNSNFAKAVKDTDYQVAKTLLLKEIATVKNRSSLYYRTLGKYLRALNMKILFDGVPGGKNQVYVIKSGDSLSRIAIAFNLPVTAIIKANKLKSTTIYPGNSLRIYKGDWRIEVSKSAKMLYVFDGNDLFAVYDIGIGKEGRTPKGNFILTDKIEHPAWYSPDGRIVPYGEKENVLGTHWLKLVPTGDTDSSYIGYGIHGTWDAGSITKSMSNGCIRMTNEEVAELFMYIPRQTPVKIY